MAVVWHMNHAFSPAPPMPIEAAFKLSIVGNAAIVEVFNYTIKDAILTLDSGTKVNITKPSTVVVTTSTTDPVKIVKATDKVGGVYVIAADGRSVTSKAKVSTSVALSLKTVSGATSTLDASFTVLPPTKYIKTVADKTTAKEATGKSRGITVHAKDATVTPPENSNTTK